MKAILEPFSHIFNTITESIKSEVINRVQLEPRGGGLNANMPAYTVNSLQDDDLSQIWSRGATALPSNTPLSFQCALQKFNLCDSARYSMLTYIIQAVQKVYGRADGVVIDNVVPRMMLAYPGDEPAVCNHSVCIITSASGEQQYIADFTLEQFGYESESWFLKRSDYHDLVCSEFGRLCIDEE
jgi:hypothetical protein